MGSIAHESRKALEARGECVIRANVGWLAVLPNTWRRRIKVAKAAGREGPNLIIYRTRSGDPRDHYVIPFAMLRDLLVDSTLNLSKAHGRRWDANLEGGVFRIAQTPIDVRPFHRAPLLIEAAAPDEPGAPQEADWTEGAMSRVTTNRYERDPRARDECLRLHGKTCWVCGFDFGAVYGLLGAEFIFVHHRFPIAARAKSGTYRPDPARDLVPLCGNCHPMVHVNRPDPGEAIESRLPQEAMRRLLTLRRETAGQS